MDSSASASFTNRGTTFSTDASVTILQGDKQHEYVMKNAPLTQTDTHATAQTTHGPHFYHLKEALSH